MLDSIVRRVPLLAALVRLSPKSVGSGNVLQSNSVGAGSVVLGWGNLPIAAPSEEDVRCHFCEDLILVGDAVTLYHPVVEDVGRPAVFHTCRRGTRSIIGCARKHCAKGAERAGTLTPFAGTLVSGTNAS